MIALNFMAMAEEEVERLRRKLDELFEEFSRKLEKIKLEAE